MAIDMTIVLIVSCFIISIYFILKPKGSKLNLPPCPPTLPIIGNLHQIGLGLPQRAFLDLAKKYGPVMRLQLGQTPIVVISSPRLAEEVLKTNDLAFANRPHNLLTDILMYGGIDVVFGQYSDYWRQMKKMVTVELLSAKKVQSFMAFREEEVNRFTNVILSSCGKPVDMHKRFLELNNNVVCKALFGNNCRQQDVLIEVADQVLALSTGFMIADLFPKLGFLSVLSGMKSKLIKVKENLDKIFDEIFEDRRIKRRTSGAMWRILAKQFGGAGITNDLTDVLFNIKERGGLPFPITDNNIKAIFLNILVGGTDTSAVTLEWAMTELMRNPDVMKKAQTEVREAFKGQKTVKETDLSKLVYIKLIIKETLRLRITLPLLILRECREQCQIGGYDIPVKMKVLISALACATDPEYWEDPESFKPERFEDSSIDFFGKNFAYIPFGAGRRICPGAAFSLISMELTLAKLLYHFNWELPDGLHPKDIDISEGYNGAAPKKDSLQLIPILHIPF